MQFIMLGGKGGVGKTALARHIAEYAFSKGLRPRIVSFADVIKRESEAAGYSKVDEPEKYRAYCQEAGRKHRKEDPDYFIKKFNESFLSLWDEEKTLLSSDNKFWEYVVIVDDCRFLNEVAYGRHYSATQLFISSGDRELYENDASWRSDLSEDMSTRIEGGDKDYGELFSWVLLNEGTWEEFTAKIEEFLPMWCGLDADSCGDIDCECDFCSMLKDEVSDNTVLREIYEQMIDYLDDIIEDLDGEEDEET